VDGQARAERTARLGEAFRARTRRDPAVAVRAPGRVNLIGEHTDYQEGLVLPCAIDRDTLVVAAPRGDGVVRAFSLDLGAETRFETGRLARRGDWSDYLQAPVRALAERGLAVAGAELGIASTVPRESGLSSSAALGVAVVRALDRLHGFGLSAEDVARVAHRGENAFVGTGCGVMDQAASALGRAGCVLRIDCRSLEVQVVPFAGVDAALLIAGSGVARRLAEGGYRARVDECAEALARLRAAGVAPRARALRDLAPEDLPAARRALPEALFRRVRHVVTENARVDATCEALRRGDLEAVGARLREGMASLRDDFEVSTPELDALCTLADAQPGVFGSRLTGAGFGGCTLHLVRPDAAAAAAEAVADGFAERFGRRPPLLEVRPADGVSDLPL
jgi:galactokinase